MSVDFSPEHNFCQAQKLLKDALLNKDLIDFEIALDMGADPLHFDDSDTCAYEIALSTYGCIDFVTFCLSYGCSPHYVNHRLSKAAINYAADSVDPQIINKLLTYPNVMVGHKYQDQTPLCQLISCVNRRNEDDVVSCMDILLQHGAAAIMCDGTDMALIQSVKENPNLNHRIKKKLIDILELHINEAGRSDYSKKLSEEMQCVKVFVLSIINQDNQTFDAYLEKGVNCSCTYANRRPLQYALACGNYYALKKLLYVANEELDSVKSPLIILIRNWKETSEQYQKSFYLLIKSQGVDINEQDDFGSTALHYAVENHNEEAIRELLKRGAYIGATNQSNTMAIDGIGPELLKECLDNCVSSSGSAKMIEDNFQLAINYENLMAKPMKGRRKEQFIEEMAAIKFIAESERHRQLLEHPVIASFLSFKWHRLTYMFYGNLLLSVLFAISMSIYTFLKVNGYREDSIAMHSFRVMSCAGIVYMIIKEFLQLLNDGSRYWFSISNYIEITMITLAIIICYPFRLDPTNQRILAVSTILVISAEIFLLTGSVPLYSLTTHMRMFEVVCKSFLKSLILYAVFLITFGLCFHILFENGEGAKGSATENFNRFSSPLGTAVKTMVMLTGEFDAGAMEFHTLASYVVFLLFVFLMTIVLYNLLNGMAVSDIQAIQGQAEQSIIITRINLIIRYGQGLSSHSKQLTFNVNLNPFQPMYHRFRNLSPTSKQDIALESIGKNADRDNSNKSRTTFKLRNQRLIETAMDILEQNAIDAKRQKRKIISDNRLNTIENKLKEVCEKLENMRKQTDV